MAQTNSRHLRALAAIPEPVRALLRTDVDLGAWSESVLNTIETAWENRRDCRTLDEIPAGEVLMCHRFLDPGTIVELEARAERERLAAVGPQLGKLQDDPWTLTYRERQEVARAFGCQQAFCNARLRELTEPPAIDDEFPGFLLESPRFAELAALVRGSARPGDLDTGSADALQRFVDHYRNYMVESEAAKPRGVFPTPAEMVPAILRV